MGDNIEPNAEPAARREHVLGSEGLLLSDTLATIAMTIIATTVMGFYLFFLVHEAYAQIVWSTTS